MAIAGNILADVRDTTLVIGEGWATVREVRRVEMQAGEQELRLDGIPLQADLSSLTIRTRRLPVEVYEWRREGQIAPMDRLARQGDTVIVTRDTVSALGEKRYADGTDLPGPVWCRVRIPAGGAQELEISYQLPGLEWSVHYEVFIRGEPDGSEESVSVDVVGLLRFQNRTDQPFTNTLVRLVGSDRRVPRVAQRRPGFIDLADHPLADLWLAPHIEPPPEFIYRLPRRLNLAARSPTETPFITAHRIPSSRLFSMHSDVVPLGVTGTFRPLAQFLVFQNSARHGLGWALPPGPVEVYQGGTRRILLQEGYLPHTPINGEIRVDLGASPVVRGMRRTVGRTPEQLGFYEELYELVIENQRAVTAEVEVIERPPTTLSWDVQRVSQEYELDRSRLIMKARVAGRTQHRIDMRLRFHQPTL